MCSDEQASEASEVVTAFGEGGLVLSGVRRWGVYVLCDDLLRLVKIGVSKQPVLRATQLALKFGRSLRLVAFVTAEEDSMKSAVSLERSIHGSLAARRTVHPLYLLDGAFEWFDVTEDVALQVAVDARSHRPRD